MHEVTSRVGGRSRRVSSSTRTRHNQYCPDGEIIKLNYEISTRGRFSLPFPWIFEPYFSLHHSGCALMVKWIQQFSRLREGRNELNVSVRETLQFPVYAQASCEIHDAHRISTTWTTSLSEFDLNRKILSILRKLLGSWKLPELFDPRLFLTGFFRSRCDV